MRAAACCMRRRGARARIYSILLGVFKLQRAFLWLVIRLIRENLCSSASHSCIPSLGRINGREGGGYVPRASQPAHALHEVEDASCAVRCVEWMRKGEGAREFEGKGKHWQKI